MPIDYKDIAKKVINIEEKGLNSLRNSINNKFNDACSILLNLKGRVIVTGMGKSGHVSAKIAATLSSLGTPAFFVHPAEAIHGDLGMITKEDAIIAISKSGNTKELKGIYEYSKRFNIPLIGITESKDSDLGSLCDILLLLPISQEACSLGLAPTTSTTMSLALGDALAVSLLEAKGFSATDFKVFHPGGSLGAQLIRVKDIMHTGDDLPRVQTNDDIYNVLMIIARKSLGCAIVYKDDKPFGIITDADIRRHLSNDILSKKALDILTEDFKYINHNSLVSEAIANMNQYSITSLPVFNDANELVGLVHMHDCLRIGAL